MKQNIIEVTKNTQKPIIIDTPGEYIVKLKTQNSKLKIVVKTSLKKQESQEYRLTIEHLVPNTSSTTVMKGVVDDQAKLKFFGKLVVAKGASQTEAFLEQRVLVLSDKAQVETKPELEILNNDVVCSHAASIAPPDEKEIFYLRSRGLSQKQATQLLTEGFLNDV